MISETVVSQIVNMPEYEHGKSAYQVKDPEPAYTHCDPLDGSPDFHGIVAMDTGLPLLLYLKYGNTGYGVSSPEIQN